jgi:hypothetical protein
MSLTLDILLMSDVFSGLDRTEDWESEFTERSGSKIKFPLKLREERLNGLDINFKDPEVKEPEGKKEEINKKVKVVDTAKKKKSDNKKLF